MFKRDWRKLLLWALVLLILCPLTAFTLLRRSEHEKHLSSPSQEKFHKPRHLRLLVPASNNDTRLCKTLLSAAALHYPTATLINWQEKFDNPKLVFGGSHIAKISGVLRHLNWLQPRDDNDIVLLIDGYDVWLQLPPQVLLERYFSTIHKQNLRLERQMGKKIMKTNGIKQKILFSAQKRCWPKDSNHPSCFAVPKSTLPSDVYGPLTDTDTTVDPQNVYLKYRARYLNSGTVMGPVGAIRALFERAAAKASVDTNFGSDQSIFAEIFGEQESQRLWIAERDASTLRRWSIAIQRLLGSYSSPIEPDAAGKHRLMDRWSGAAFEYGVGLDYDSAIAQVTVFAEDDLAWLTHSKTSKISSSSSALGISPPRVSSLASDMARSRPPFHTINGGPHPSAKLPKRKTWADVPLFTNLWTGIVPVAIHHNAHRDGLKSRIETWWNETWFTPYAREMLDAHVTEPYMPVAQTRGAAGRITKWWSHKSDNGRIATDTGFPVAWTNVCASSWEVLFPDGKGEWKDPRWEGVDDVPGFD